MSISGRQSQTAYEAAKYDADTKSLDERIGSAMFRYLVEDLGLSREIAADRAAQEAAGTVGRNACEELAELGVAVAGKLVLDLGAGLGGLSAELARRGAVVVAVEPGTGWNHLAAARLRELPSSAVIAAVGESLPLASESVELVVSLQVLEHVRSPGEVIKEVFRVLKPGGHFYFAYENYFSFWEPHYRVRWLPLLPKPLGSIYLKMRGRNPQFLRESVTYTTFHGVRKLLKQAGFLCTRNEKSIAALRSPEITAPKWRFLKALAALSEPGTIQFITAADHCRRLLQTAVYECVRKAT